MAEAATRADYQRIKQQIRSAIIAGQYPVGQRIPSYRELAAQHGTSVPTVRRALDQMKDEGILEGHPGKGVFVRALPADADADRVTIESLSRQVTELREMLAERDGLDDIREAVGRLETNLIELYNKTGFDYPSGSSSDLPQEGRRRRARP